MRHGEPRKSEVFTMTEHRTATRAAEQITTTAGDRPLGVSVTFYDGSVFSLVREDDGREYIGAAERHGIFPNAAIKFMRRVLDDEMSAADRDLYERLLAKFDGKEASTE